MAAHSLRHAGHTILRYHFRELLATRGDGLTFHTFFHMHAWRSQRTYQQLGGPQRQALQAAGWGACLSEYRPVQVAGAEPVGRRSRETLPGKKSVGITTCASRRAGICRNIDLYKPFSCTSRVSYRIFPSRPSRWLGHSAGRSPALSRSDGWRDRRWPEVGIARRL